MKKKIVIISVIASLMVLLATGGYLYYLLLKKPFIPEAFPLYIKERGGYDEAAKTIASGSSSLQFKLFDMAMKQKQYDRSLQPGFYYIKENETVFGLFLTLSRAKQTPIKVTFNNIRTIDQLAGRLSRQLMADSLTFLHSLTDSGRMASYGFNRNTSPAMFVPNTYEMYWTTTPEKFMDRMHQEHKRFWNGARMAKAEKMGITPLEASIIASIAEEETNDQTEIGAVCGVYYNRIKKGMPLQADPTVKFALGNFDIRRILFVHLETDSPYNTYKYAGLPPGPIRIPETRTIDALLNHTPHRYLFFCAKEDMSGRHSFAVTNAEHERNAKRYQQELNRLKIYR